ncbi:glycosyltransferase [Priestia megaterium]|uniref:Glycosyltransferase n=1 Tax=Priestia aryabhattai TaxID=412384 RepID=A0ABD5KUT6_PRIAR|nr:MULTISPECIES: glycosyltransferase [Priestia]MBK0293987.1 glycosyltransferase [Bacillus sp. S34]UPK51354.1 glycosyltransferase [Bacillus sp. H8-1]MEB4856173.1 glycosyltransferase [Priestia megaterium]MED3817705.1 glycosyltransferase [Priestia aryabhattai]MED4044153.1 glycosyltransferase [Priestia aryabhattai]
MKTLSVVLPVYNEEETLKSVLKQIKKVNVLEIIIVANGCTDASVKIAKEEGCTVKVVEKRLSPHEARMEGAKAAKGDAVLFVDGDIILSASELERFVQPLLFEHSDVVLNKWEKTKMNAFNRSELTWSTVLHHALGKPHRANACLKAPYGVLVSVLKNHWELPPLSLFVTFLTQYRVSSHITIETQGKGSFRPFDRPLRSRERIQSYQQLLQTYYTFASHRKRRVDMLSQPLPVVEHGWGRLSSFYGGKQLSVIIPVCNEEQTLKQVIAEARKLEPLEIIVVINGSTDQSEKYAKEQGVKTIVYDERLGHDCGRAAGALAATGDILLFIDGDFVLSAQELYPFAAAVASGVDVALNICEDEEKLTHVVQGWKYVLNETIGRKDLLMSSMTAVPHAISRECLEKIEPESLAVPPFAQVKAIVGGFHVQAVHHVDVNKFNRFRYSEHLSLKSHSATAELIIQDHIFAFLSYLQRD